MTAMRLWQIWNRPLGFFKARFLAITPALEAGDVSLGFLSFDCLAFIVTLAALGHGQFHLGNPAPEVDLERDQG